MPQVEAFDPRMTERDFAFFASLIHEHLGIKMPPVKQAMLESRLRKRLRMRGVAAYADYRALLESAEGQQDELIPLIDAVTTNKTDFFREPAHFRLLAESLLPSTGGPLRAWSAGCSTGEEAYTLAMILADHGERFPGFSFSIFATDISTRVLEAAARGIYPEERVEPVPPEFRRRYLMRSRDRGRGLVRVVPELRERVTFGRLNLIDAAYDTGALFDVLFCRNVLIYFERAEQARIVEKLLRRLAPGGHLFLGHSETMQGMGLAARQVAPMVYRKEGR